jgi:hypothetical protein
MDRFLGLERAEWWFLAKWVLGVGLGVGVGMIVGALTFLVLGNAMDTGSDREWMDAGRAIGQVLGLILGWVVGWAAVGAAQWSILQEQVHLPAWWVLVNVVGAVIGVGVGWVIAVGVTIVGGIFWVRPMWVRTIWAVIESAIAGAGGGSVLGAAQWLILRKRVHQSGRWVLASAVGLGVSVGVGWGLIVLVGTMVGRAINSVWGIGLGWVLALLVGGAVYGTVTGRELIVLLRRPILEA